MPPPFNPQNFMSQLTALQSSQGKPIAPQALQFNTSAQFSPFNPRFSQNLQGMMQRPQPMQGMQQPIQRPVGPTLGGNWNPQQAQPQGMPQMPSLNNNNS